MLFLGRPGTDSEDTTGATMVGVALRSDADETLSRLIGEAGDFSVEFPFVLANHLPMVLFALDRLGASEQRLTTFFETYRANCGLVPIPPAIGPIDSANWRNHLGEREREADYRAFFAGEVRRLGRADACRTYLPVLVPGLAASATHALMRLGYASLREDPHETGIALAYLCCTYLPLRQAGSAEPDTDDPVEMLARMRTIDAFKHVESPTDLLWHWMRATAEMPEFAPVVDWLDVRDGGIDRVAAASLRLMAATMTFEALHAVTGTHWVRLIQGFGCDDLALRYFWQAICSVYPKIGMPVLPDETAFEEMRRLPCPDWPEIMAAACASDDEHDISFTFSASEEQRIRGDRLYQVTAARRLGLIT